MLNENIKVIRKSKGLSQQDLANKLNVVRQTVSKWEQGFSVPDSSMLISLAEAFDTSISSLLGETIVESKVDDLNLISKKTGSYKFTIFTAKNQKKKNSTLVSYLIVHSHNNNFFSFVFIRKSLFELGL